MKPKIRSKSKYARLKGILTSKWIVWSAILSVAGLFAILYLRPKTIVTAPGKIAKLAEPNKYAPDEVASASATLAILPTIAKSSKPSVCGVAWEGSTIVGQSDLNMWDKARYRASENARKALVDTLLSRASPKEHAAGLFLNATGIAPGFAACSGDECKSIAENHNLVVEQSVRQLAEMGRVTESPEIYAWAQSACYLSANGSSIRPSACSNLSNLRLAELAPTNVWPWLALASAAGRDGDLSGQETALLHASQATDWRNPNAELARIVLQNIPNDMEGLPRADLLGELIGEQGSNNAGLVAVAAFCGPDPDANKTQICTGLVEHILQNPEDLTQLSLGIRIAKHAALSGVDLSKAETDLRLLKDKIPQYPAQSPGAAQACVGVPDKIRYFESIAQIGEVRTLRRN